MRNQKYRCVHKGKSEKHLLSAVQKSSIFYCFDQKENWKCTKKILQYVPSFEKRHFVDYVSNTKHVSVRRVQRIKLSQTQ